MGVVKEIELEVGNAVELGRGVDVGGMVLVKAGVWVAMLVGVSDGSGVDVGRDVDVLVGVLVWVASGFIEGNGKEIKDSSPPCRYRCQIKFPANNKTNNADDANAIYTGLNCRRRRFSWVPALVTTWDLDLSSLGGKSEAQYGQKREFAGMDLPQEGQNLR